MTSSDTMSPEGLEAALREIGRTRYHDNHPFHALLRDGKLEQKQVQAWALNRYYYQSRIPMKDAAFMSRVDDPSRLRFRNMVEVTDLDALRASGADLLVLHKTQSSLHFRTGGYGSIDIAFIGVARMVASLKDEGKAPIFEDDELAVFRIADL